MATRRERVVLELEDQFTTGMARAAASAALLNKELDSLSRDAVRTRRGFSDIDAASSRFGTNAGRTGNQIDRLSGRMRIFADLAAALGPALVPIGGVGLAAISGLAAQFGFAATGALTAVLAFQGVGDTLKSLNAAALDPTVENLEKAQIALERLTPQAQAFVGQLGSMIPEFRALRDTAAEGLFPGLTRGFDDLERVLPRVEDIVSSVSTELGNIAANTGESLASDRWTPFLEFLEREAPSALSDMAEAAGNTGHALAELWMATDPVNDDFSRWIVDATADLDRWAAGLSQTQGFADFLAYVETTGPKVAETFGAIGNAVVQILQAAAPLGGPVLQGVEALADVVAAFASSDLGTPLLIAVAAMSLFNRTLGLTRAIAGTTWGSVVAGELKASAGIRTLIADLRILNRESRIVTLPGKNFIGPLTQAQAAATRLKATLPAVAKSAALITGVAVASTGAADKIGLTNTASLALMGTLGGPWGVAVGGAVGLMIDAKNAGDGFADAMNKANLALKGTDASALEASIRALKKQRDDLTDVTGIGDFFGDVGSQLTRPKELLPGAASSVDRIDEKLKKLKGQLEFTQGEARARLLADGFEATSEGIDSATSSTEALHNELEKLSTVLTGRATFRDFEQAVDDFAARAQRRAEIIADIRRAQADLAASETPDARDSAKDRIKALRKQADELKNSLDVGVQAGRDTQDALDAIATAALRVAAGLDPIARTEFLAGARTEFVKAAIEAGHTKDAAQELADKVLGLSKVKGRPKIIIDADGAWQVISETERRLRRLSKYVTTLRIEVQRDLGGIDGDPKTPDFATGGWTGPGSKYQPAGVVHADEFVFSKEATHGRVAELTALHNKLRGYANGGLVQRFPSQSFASPAIDYDRLARAMSAARPLYGDVTVVGDGSFRRELTNDLRMSAIDGVRR